MRRTFVLITVLVSCFLFLVSCFGTDFVDIEISAAQTNSTEKSRAVYSVQKYDFDPSMLKDEVKGKAAASVTPSAFILDIDRIRLFNPVDTSDVTKGVRESLSLVNTTTYNGGAIIPKRYNMLSSKGITSFSLPLSILRKNWHGLALMIRPGGNEETNGMWAGSIIGISIESLPSSITADKIVNTLTVLPFGIEYPDDTVWFSFYDLIPFRLGGMLGYITFSDGVDDVSLINPEGNDGTWCYGSENSHGNQSGVVYPMETVNLSNLRNPEITISVDTENLIEFYETEDGRYYASLSKSNPFPFRIIVDEYDAEVFLYTEQAVTDIKDAYPFDCFDYVMDSKDGRCHVLVHTEPNYSGLSGVEVYRSTSSTFDERAELIYTGDELSIVDYGAPENVDVYYFIRSVNTKGEVSSVRSFMRIDSRAKSGGRV